MTIKAPKLVYLRPATADGYRDRFWGDDEPSTEDRYFHEELVKRLLKALRQAKDDATLDMKVSQMVGALSESEQQRCVHNNKAEIVERKVAEYEQVLSEFDELMDDENNDRK